MVTVSPEWTVISGSVPAPPVPLNPYLEKSELISKASEYVSLLPFAGTVPPVPAGTVLVGAAGAGACSVSGAGAWLLLYRDAKVLAESDKDSKHVCHCGSHRDVIPPELHLGYDRFCRYKKLSQICRSWFWFSFFLVQ